MNQQKQKLDFAKHGRRLMLILTAFVFLILLNFADKPLIANQPLAHADVIFIFSGSGEYGKRTFTAADFYHAGTAPKVILTNDNVQAGWEPGEERNPFYWEWERWTLLIRGVPPDAIEVLPQPVKGTHDEAVLLVKTAKERGWHSIFLVTSPSHTRRALWTMEHVAAEENADIKFGIAPAVFGSPPRFWWTSRENWRNISSEYVKFVYYWLFY